MDNNMNDNFSDVIETENNKNTVRDSSREEHSHHGEHHHHSSHHSSEHHHHSSHHSSGHHHHSSHHSSGHHSHHSSSHHHHRRKSHRGKKKQKINPKLIWTIVAILAVAMIALVIVFELMPRDHNRPNDSSDSDILSVEVINQEGVLVKEAVRKYLLEDMLNSYNANVRLSDFSENEGRLDAQVPVSLKLSVTSGLAMAYKIELADNDLFENARVSFIDGAKTTYEFRHLYANTQYFYRVTVYTNNDSDSQTGSFKTADTPRLLTVDGLSYVSDIGNWRTDSGKHIKQGLLIRGTEMDGAVASGYHLTNEGLKDMLDVFGIKTEIDLRAQTPTTMDALGPRVEHRYYDMVMYDGIFTEEGKDKIRMVFADLANPDNYPIYLHCTYGCDRTGTVCYLLEAVLGVSRGDCLKEYGLSDLNIKNITIIENGLKQYEGSTLKEQAESYLLSCGLSEYQIESIRNIFLGE